MSFLRALLGDEYAATKDKERGEMAAAVAASLRLKKSPGRTLPVSKSPSEEGHPRAVALWKLSKAAARGFFTGAMVAAFIVVLGLFYPRSAPPFVQYQLQNGAYVQQPQAQGAMLMQTGALRGGGFAGAAVTTGAGGGVASLQRFQGQTQGVQMVGLGGNQAAAGAGVAVAPGGGAGASLAGAGIPLVRTVPDDPAAVVDREHSAIRKPGEQTAEATVGGAAVGGGATATAAAVANAGATDAQEAGEGEPGGGEAKAEEAIQTAVAGAAAATAAGEEEGAPQDALKCGSIFDPAALSKAAKDFKKVLWKPQPGKFLLAYCTRGEISSRILCYQRTLLVAALTNRVLVVPMREAEQEGTPYDLRMAFHLDTARGCYGDDVILSTEEFEKKYNGEKVKVDRLQCWHGAKGSCEATPAEQDFGCPAVTDPDTALPSTGANDVTKLGVPGKRIRVGANSHLAKMFGGASAAAQGACLGATADFKQVVSAFGSFQDRVLAVGDLSERSVLDPAMPYPFLELILENPKKCDARRQGGVVAPHPGFLVRSFRAMKTIMTEKDTSSIALHWTRPKPGPQCAGKDKPGECGRTPEEAASCTASVAEMYGTAEIYMTTDASEEEVAAYRAKINAPGKDPLVIKTFNPLWSPADEQRSWIQRTFPNGNVTLQMELAQALCDRLIAARTKFFLGTPGSAITDDIVRARYSIRTLNCLDTHLCSGAAEWDGGFST